MGSIPIARSTDDGMPVRSLRSHLATLTRNTVRFGGGTTMEILAMPSPTPLQRRTFDLLAIKLAV